jgi:hypothetical protein
LCDFGCRKEKLEEPEEKREQDTGDLRSLISPFGAR